jgi:hypothetical protein
MKSCLLPGNKAGEIPFVPAILFLKKKNGLCPPPRGRKVLVNVYALSTRISVLFWMSACTVRIKYWRSYGHCFTRN